MKQLFLVTLFLAFVENSIAQADYERRTLNAKKTLDSIMVSEKNILKEKLKEIDKLLDIKQITKEVASEKKAEAVLAFEQKIKAERKKIVDNFWENSKEIQADENISKKIDSIFQSEAFSKPQKNTVAKDVYIGVAKSRSSYPKKVHLARGRTGFTFALGFHNMSSAEHISNDKFRVWGSKSVEIGFFRDVRIFKNHNLLHFNYGLSWMMDKLKMKGDDYFVNSNGITEIRPYAVPVIKSKFKSHYLILPISLEFDLTPSYTHSNSGKEYFPSHRSFRFGVGGYVGLLLNNKQKVKYRLSGTNYKDVSYSDYNVNEWTYGVSAYLGVGNGVFYARYSLVPLFRNNPVKEYPFSIGIRWDWL